MEQRQEDRTRALLERHRQAGHTPNRLIEEKSPYLLQHAYNPVEWYPWGDAAFDRARHEDRLVFLSVGYATCHWCHVMAHESFEDEAVAAFLNENFVSIKLDREERPDIDRIYMAVVQATSGSGGWPMTVFLTPDRRPVFGGTYFPPRGAYGRPGFLDVLRRLAQMWRERRSELERAAGSVVDSIRGYLEGAPQASDPDAVDLAAAAAGAAAGYDAQEGGFGPAPKFPRPSVVSLLLRHPDADGAEGRRHRDMALHTLDAMAAGGMYDHLGGGFHRYSVDRHWRVPHFEKMLYDQGQLMRAYVEAFQATGAERYAATARHTADYLLRDLTTADGAFCSAEDADSAVSTDDPEHSREGAFYLWGLRRGARRARRGAIGRSVHLRLRSGASRQHAERPARRAGHGQRALSLGETRCARGPAPAPPGGGSGALPAGALRAARAPAAAAARRQGDRRLERAGDRRAVVAGSCRRPRGLRAGRRAGGRLGAGCHVGRPGR